MYVPQNESHCSTRRPVPESVKSGYRSDKSGVCSARLYFIDRASNGRKTGGVVRLKNCTVAFRKKKSWSTTYNLISMILSYEHSSLYVSYLKHRKI